MLFIVGGRRSSCVRGHRRIEETGLDIAKVGGAVYCDCGSSGAVRRLMALRLTDGCVYVLEHAYFALDSGRATKDVKDFAEWVGLASQVCTVFVLTRDVSMITKKLRDVARLAFDFS